MNHEESSIQKRIVAVAELCGVFVFSVPNEAAGRSSVQKIQRLKAMGLYPGMSDLVFVGKDGQVGFIEVKTGKGRLSDKQRDFKSLCEANGWRHEVVRSANEALEVFARWKDAVI